MKFNRNKMGSVVVVMILALTPILSGCTPPAGNRTPGFLRVGGTYWMVSSGGEALGPIFSGRVRVVEMRHDGWILVEQPDQLLPEFRYSWINTTQLIEIREDQQ